MLTLSWIATVPIWLALLGKARCQTLAWRWRVVPLGAGLGLIHPSASRQVRMTSQPAAD